MPGPAVLCADDAGLPRAGVTSASSPVTYGLDPAADYQVVAPAPDGTGVRVRRCVHGDERASRSLLPAAPGVHNARNAAGALAVAHRLGVPLAEGAAALAGFQGVARRFERRGEAGGVTVVDGYAHLPDRGGGRAGRRRRRARGDGWWPCSSPTATAAPRRCGATSPTPSAPPTCWPSPTSTPRARRRGPGVSGKLVVDAVLDAHPWAGVAWLPTLDDVLPWLSATLRPGDLCLTLGAGDLTSLAPRIVAMLEARS